MLNSLNSSKMPILKKSVKNDLVPARLSLNFPLIYNGKNIKRSLLLSHCTWIFWQKFYRNVSWVVLYQTYHFCPMRWIWLDAKATQAMAIERLKLRKKQSKIISSEAIRGMKLKLCRNVHNIISLYKNYVFFLLLLLMHFHCNGNVKFSSTYNRKSENMPLLLSHCRYFDKCFTELFLVYI